MTLRWMPVQNLHGIWPPVAGYIPIQVLPIAIPYLLSGLGKREHCADRFSGGLNVNSGCYVNPSLISRLKIAISICSSFPAGIYDGGGDLWDSNASTPILNLSAQARLAVFAID